ncbi:MAG TPA: GNAT family N-acetyltransferase [Balneolaceae bacterium]|nr:GNAT family N-acetyltransferase [Balneolaceae bacterium]
MNQGVQVVEMDYKDERQSKDFLFLMDQYARDPMGLEDPLPIDVKNLLCLKLQELPGAATFLAYKDKGPVGLATCLTSFSTFDARKAINIHDLFVISEERGLGIGDRLLQAIQKRARQMDCCQLTIEVRDDNHSARKLYERFGFEEGDPPLRFMKKGFY